MDTVTVRCNEGMTHTQLALLVLDKKLVLSDIDAACRTDVETCIIKILQSRSKEESVVKQPELEADRHYF